MSPRTQKPPVPCVVEEVELPGDNCDIDSVRATCSKCGHQTESYGTADASIRRCLAMMRDECPNGERNRYEQRAAEPEPPRQAPRSTPARADRIVTRVAVADYFAPDGSVYQRALHDSTGDRPIDALALLGMAINAGLDGGALRDGTEIEIEIRAKPTGLRAFGGKRLVWDGAQWVRA